MRSTKYSKIKKCATRTKINKKKNARKSKRSWGFNNNVSVTNLDNINEILRVRKTQRAEGSWKLIPKDSCEVYKARRRRQLKSEDEDPQSDESSSENSHTRPKRDKTRINEMDRRAKRKLKNVRKNRRNTHSDSSLPSHTSCSSMSTASCASTSDMEYN